MSPDQPAAVSTATAAFEEALALVARARPVGGAATRAPAFRYTPPGVVGGGGAGSLGPAAPGAGAGAGGGAGADALGPAAPGALGRSS